MIQEKKPFYTERQHAASFDAFLVAIRGFKEKHESPFPGLEKLVPLIRDNLDIARSVGYVDLADSYEALYGHEGLILEKTG